MPHLFFIWCYKDAQILHCLSQEKILPDPIFRLGVLFAQPRIFKELLGRLPVFGQPLQHLLYKTRVRKINQTNRLLIN